MSDGSSVLTASVASGSVAGESVDGSLSGPGGSMKRAAQIAMAEAEAEEALHEQEKTKQLERSDSGR